MNAGVLNGNFRSGDYKALADQIKADALDPAIVHPREVKLAQLRELMGVEKYAAWYERSRGLNVAKWTAVIDAELSALTPAPAALVVGADWETHCADRDERLNAAVANNATVKTPADGIRAHLAKQAARRKAEDAAPDLRGNAHMLNMWHKFFTKHNRRDLARAVVAAGDMTPELHAQWLALTHADTRRATRLSNIETY